MAVYKSQDLDLHQTPLLVIISQSLISPFNTHLKTNLLSVDRLPPPTAGFDLQLFSDPWRIVVLVGDSIVGSASLLPILPICLTPVESREVYQISL